MGEPRCIFPGCVSTDRHWHGGFYGGYDNPDDPEGPPIPFTTEPAPGVRDYNGALLSSEATGGPIPIADITGIDAIERSLLAELRGKVEALLLLPPPNGPLSDVEDAYNSGVHDAAALLSPDTGAQETQETP